MVPGKAIAHCSIVRLAKRSEGLGVQSLADHSNLPLTGCRAFVLHGTKRFHDKPQGRTVPRDAGSVLTSCDGTTENVPRAAPITVVVVTAKKTVITRQSTGALTVSSGMSRRTSRGNGASVPQ